MNAFAEQKEKKEKPEKQAPVVRETVQRDLSEVNGPEGGMLPNEVSSRIQSMRGGGQSLSDRSLKRFSEHFGRDMSDVRIHTDSASDTISRSLNARAFTIGSDVFLTKGINPDGGGRDQQTMMHELTHVVQQNGHASSGPLKLGAADTPQEHEASATAQREYSAENKAPETESVQREQDTELDTEEEAEDTVQRETEEETSIEVSADSDTIQRGFWSDLANKIGEGFLEYTGMDAAYKEFKSGEAKVKAALEGMSEDGKEQFEKLGEEIVDFEENKLPNAQRGEETGSEAENDEDGDYEDLYEQYEDALEKQLELLQMADSSVTESDLNKYRAAQKGENPLFASFTTALKANFWSGFKKTPEEQQKARQQMISDSAEALGQKSRSEDKTRTDRKNRKELIKSVWREVQKDEEKRNEYGTWVNFRSQMNGQYKMFIDDELGKGTSVENIRTGLLDLLGLGKDKKKKKKGAK